MLMIQDKLVREDILEECFCCDLAACKGACCVEGEGGAPLEPEELSILEEIFPAVEPYLSAEGKEVLAAQGLYLRGPDGGWETPLVHGRECAYLTYDAHGVAKCGIEQAWAEGKISFQKPVSCHLYPIRVVDAKGFPMLLYHRWSVCKSACALGKSLKLPLYVFLKEAIVRAFGVAFYEDLEGVAQARAAQAGKRSKPPK